MASILVLGELAQGRPQSITAELLAAGRRLGEALGEEVAAAFLGAEMDAVSGEAIARGADKVYLVQDPLLAGPQMDLQLAAFEQVCAQTEPSVVLVGRTPMGADIGPRLAFRMGVGMAQDCVEVGIDAETGRLVATRPVYWGSAVAKVTFPDADPQIVVIRPKTYEPLEADPSRSGKVIAVQVYLDSSMAKTRLVKTVSHESEGVRLEDAAVVVGGGRGLGGPEPFELLKELAQLLGGAVAASGAVCDAGWLDHGYKVGLTGKTITPELYITVGISGASQHLAGCSGAKHVMAINRDADANIFKAADFGVVGDWNKVLPSFIEAVRELVR